MGTSSWEGRALGSQQVELSWWVLGVTRSRQSVGVGAEVERNGREQERGHPVAERAGCGVTPPHGYWDQPGCWQEMGCKGKPSVNGGEPRRGERKEFAQCW